MDERLIERHAACVAEDGYTIVEDAIAPALVAELRDETRRLERALDIRPLNTLAEGNATLRMYNLLAKSPLFRRMPTHPNVLALVDRLMPGCLLSGMTTIDIGPGERGQPVHADDLAMNVPRPHPPFMIVAMWALTDFTANTGATRYYPGSHRWPESPDFRMTYDDAAALEMPAGSVMVFHGSLWHAGGPNTTADRWRLGVNVQYCAGWIRTQQNHYVGIPRDIAATFDDRLLELLGYRLYKGAMGHVDGHAPGEALFGERMAERAYTYERYRG
ncbi:MAG TPA: phytanoyl-CoA dioxygenase family protein [Candidatus Binatia bacterium]|nr:phytanoyl-CoA dioxygenase family protein [Candidatus Binatia bacterium]